MAKIQTSKKQKTFSLKAHSSQAKMQVKNTKKPVFILREDAHLKEYDPIKGLLDVNAMGAAIMQCFIENDPDGVLEVIENYLYALNKTQFLKEAKVPRSTMYNFLRSKNPTIKTLAKLIHASYH